VSSYEWLYWSSKNRKRRLCNSALDYAQSDDPEVQMLAFKTIARSIRECDEMRDIFYARCKARGEPVEAAIFSWKRPNDEYSVRWDLHFRLASYYLASWPAQVMDDISRRGVMPLVGFSKLEEIFENHSIWPHPIRWK